MNQEETKPSVEKSCLPDAWLEAGKFDQNKFTDWVCGRKVLAAYSGTPSEIQFYLQGRLYVAKGEPTIPF